MQVLISTMFQEDFSLHKRMNIKGNYVVINQTDFNNYPNLAQNEIDRIYFSTDERGLSKSRNLALKSSSSEICIIADDDVVYFDNYEHIISEAYNKFKNADLILFDYVLEDGQISNKLSKESGKINILQALKGNSVRITFKRQSIVNNGINFNESFGSGSGKFIASEDIVFISDCFKKGLKVYYVNIPIHTLAISDSTWFKGFNHSYFETLGAFSYHLLKGFWFLFAFQFIIRHPKKIVKYGFLKSFISMSAGKKKYKITSSLS